MKKKFQIGGIVLLSLFVLCLGGAWAKEVVAPGDVGGPHRIEAKVSGDVAAEVEAGIYLLLMTS